MGMDLAETVLASTEEAQVGSPETIPAVDAASPGPKVRRLSKVASEAATPGSAQKRQAGEDTAGEQPTPKSAAKRPKKSAGPPVPEIVLVDGGEPQARTWRICSENKVNVRKGMAHDSESLKHLPSGEEFEAEGPFRINKRGEKFQWLKLVGASEGFVCTCSSKDADKLVAVLKRKSGGSLDTALLIKPEWCRQIFEKGKTWEIRGEKCNRRSRFAIGASGTGTLVGEATMINCLKVGKVKDGKLKRWSKEHKQIFIGRQKNFPKHRIKDMSIVTYPKVYAWVLDDVVRYKVPVPYRHPQGAIKWIKLDADCNTADGVEDPDAGYRSSPEPERRSPSKASSSSSSKSSSKSSSSSASGEDAKEPAAETKEPESGAPPSEVSKPAAAATVSASAPVAAAAPVAVALPVVAPVAAASPAAAVVAPPVAVPAVVLKDETPLTSLRRLRSQPSDAKPAASAPVAVAVPVAAVAVPAAAATAALPPVGENTNGSGEIIQRLQKVVASIKAGPDEAALKNLLDSLLGPAGHLGAEPVKVMRETKAGFALNDLRRHPSPDVCALASKVRDHWKELARKGHGK